MSRVELSKMGIKKSLGVRIFMAMKNKIMVASFKFNLFMDGDVKGRTILSYGKYHRLFILTYFFHFSSITTLHFLYFFIKAFYFKNPPNYKILLWISLGTL